MGKDNKMLEYVANWIASGFTRGYNPYWELSSNNIQHSELSMENIRYIASAVAEGYVEGEIVQGSTNGWWKIQF